MRKFISILILFISLPIFANEYKPQQGYSLEPLGAPVYDWAHVVADTVTFNNWLNANYLNLTREKMKGSREHLYYLISSYASDLYKKNKSILPKNHDPILETLFSWSERLGVYGASLVYNQIKNEKMKPMPMLMKIHPTFKLTFQNDLYNLESLSSSWSIKFPYYFMIGNLSDFKAANGMQTQVLSVSTGASKDKTTAGQSQATLMILFSPSSDFEGFSKFWLRNFEMSSNSKTTNLGIKNLSSQYTYDKSSLLHKEFTFWKTEKGSMAVAYMGMDGTYQANRQHFLDFLFQLQSPSAITAN